MRIAIISTPRSGNTWLRKMLAALCEGDEIAIHSPNDLNWKNLPTGNCVLQLHWRKTPQVEQLLMENGFKIIVLLRHPLDVLISILQFAHQEPQTIHWLSGEGGDEKNIYGKSPASKAFLEYAISLRARSLLSISIEWREAPDAVLVRYHDLVSNTQKTLYDLTEKLGIPQLNIETVIANNNIDKLRLTSDNGHFWQGKTGLWHRVIPSYIVKTIAQNQEIIFSKYEFEYTQIKKLSTIEAERNWSALCQ